MRNMRRYSFITALVIILIEFGGCASTESLQDPSTGATLWVQNAAEFDALTLSVYQTAMRQLDDALRANAQTAAMEQKGQNYQSLPPAVILDVDETVLDNSPFQARLIKQHAHYTPQKWNRWVREANAEAVAGAVDFTKQAAEEGATVFYLTNREVQLEDATLKNLKKRGFPVKKDVDVLLMKNERPDWTSDKVNRRHFVAKNYRIIMLFGDNLNDFLPATGITQKKRHQLVRKNKAKFGARWFILPNPTYGSWQKALYDFDESLSPNQIEKRKEHMLHTKK